MNYEQKYKDALERARILIEKLEANHIKGFIYHIFPELMESEDEKIRKELMDFIYVTCFPVKDLKKKERFLAWLEKQTNTSNKEYVFRPLAGDTIEKAAERAVELGGKVVLAFNGAYIPVDSKTKDEIVAEYRNWLEKQDKKKIYTFKSIPRLLDMIEPTSKAKAYCQKLIASLVKEGYSTDAKIVSDCLKQMNGEKVAMATMDEKQGEQKPIKASYTTIVETGNGGINAVVERDLLTDGCYGEKNSSDRIESKTLDADKVIAWLVGNICDFEYYVKRFKQDFGL